MNIDFTKNNDGLVAAIIQDSTTKNVLMLGYMNEDAFNTTEKTKTVTFYSRSNQRLWMQGEESGNVLNVVDIKLDCDNDTLLILVKPEGPTRHKGSYTCWNTKNEEHYGFISILENTIESRIKSGNSEYSYVASLFEKGINKIAQKVGEEAIEVVIEAKDNNDELFLSESADLLFHYLLLLQAKGFKINDVVSVLQEQRPMIFQDFTNISFHKSG